MEHPKEVATNVAMAAPSVINLITQKVFGVTLNEGLAVVSIVFILVQMAYLIWKWIREARRA